MSSSSPSLPLPLPLKYMNDAEMDRLFDQKQQGSQYSNACILYQNKGYDITHAQRSNTINTNTELRDQENKIKSCFRRFVPDKPIAFFRGIEAMYQYKTLCDFNNIKEAGFCSTSTVLSAATKFVNMDDQQEQCCVLHIHIDAGQSFTALPILGKGNVAFSKESEIVFPPGTTFAAITDPKLLLQIQEAMGYQPHDSTYIDRFRDGDGEGDGDVKTFKAVTFKKKGVIIVPVILKVNATGGKHWKHGKHAKQTNPKYKKSDMKKMILGIERVIYFDGRKQYVKYKGGFISIHDARKKKYA